jgi:hypothetical protein
MDNLYRSRPSSAKLHREGRATSVHLFVGSASRNSLEDVAKSHGFATRQLLRAMHLLDSAEMK